MTQKILVLFPKNTLEGQPSFERVRAFRDIFIEQGMSVLEAEQPVSFKEKWALIKLIKSGQIKNIFNSMPQFRNWWLFWLNSVNIILDIRDGWSIAMRSGYGGTVKPSTFKAWIARRIERFALNRAALTITCTPGLQAHLQKVTGKEVLLILNGYSEKDKEIVGKIRSEMLVDSNPNELIAIVVGQFSEYGRDKAEIVIKKLSKKYCDKKIVLRLVGSNPEKNAWIANFIQSNKIHNIRFEILKRMSRESMYKQILRADVGVTIIRDPDYEFGTKVFDYILCGKEIFNYFDDANLFSDFFIKNKNESCHCFSRNELIMNHYSRIKKIIK